MRGFYLICFTFLLISSSIFPQWTNQNIVPDGNHLWSTFFINDNTGWISGSDGFIKKTTNGGLDWFKLNTNTNISIRAIQFIDESTGWLCGEDGMILKSYDGGQSWSSLTSNTNNLLTDLQFIDSNTGYVVGFGGLILKSTDGGSTWNVLTSGTTNNLYSVDFVDDLLGFAVGDDRIFLKTTDGGQNWIGKSLVQNGAPILNCVEFINSEVGWIGYGFDRYSSNIKKTTDGGETWFTSLYTAGLKPIKDTHNEMNNPFDIQVGIRSIYFSDLNNGYAVGGTQDGWNRCVFSTTDGGNTWQTNYIYSEQTGLLSVKVNANGSGFAVGYSGVIYLTGDNGKSWSQILSGNNNLYYTGDWITSVFMIDENVGWAGGYRKGIWYYPILLKTTNGGKIWQTNFEFTDSFVGTEANIFFLNENIGWVNFYDKGSYKTTDGGESWFSTGNAGNQKLFINQDTGWGTYSPLGIFKSTNGGSDWVKKSTANCRSIYFSDLNNGWAVGESGNIFNSTNEGENWYQQVSGTSLNLNCVNFFNSNIGMCVGNSGIILSTADGGQNWVSQNIGSTSKLNSVVFANSNSTWIAGNDGTILFSGDLGTNWTQYDELTNNNLVSVYFINENTGWFGGSLGTILKYEANIVPVELISFTARLKEGSVELNWQTATEVNNLGFEIERSSDIFSKPEWEKIGFAEGQGNSASPISYLFVDNNPIGGNKYYYRLKQIDFNGQYKYSNEVEIELIPNKFELLQNYPNPFNPSTKIRYQLPITSNVEIRVYDMLGAEVLSLLNESKQPGTYEVEFNANNLSSGTYVYRIIAGSFIQTRKMVLLK